METLILLKTDLNLTTCWYWPFGTSSGNLISKWPTMTHLIKQRMIRCVLILNTGYALALSCLRSLLGSDFITALAFSDKWTIPDSKEIGRPWIAIQWQATTVIPLLMRQCSWMQSMLRQARPDEQLPFNIHPSKSGLGIFDGCGLFRSSWGIFSLSWPGNQFLLSGFSQDFQTYRHLPATANNAKNLKTCSKYLNNSQGMGLCWLIAFSPESCMSFPNCHQQEPALAFGDRLD